VRAGLAAALLAVSAAASAAEPGPPLELGFELDLASRYRWRGLELSSGPVVQPALWLSSGALTVSLWANGDFNSRRPEGVSYGVNEVDVAVAWELALGDLAITPTAQSYTTRYGGATSTTVEVGLEAALPVGPLELTMALSRDVVQAPGAGYGEFGIGWRRALHPERELELRLTAAGGTTRFLEDQMDLAVRGVYVVSGSAAMTLQRDGFPAVRLHAEVAVLTRERVRAALGGGAPRLAAGVSRGV
jgi:hypothetical protein